MAQKTNSQPFRRPFITHQHWPTEGSQVQTHWLTTRDGGRLRYTYWPLAGGKSAVILTGRGEPSDKYFEVAAQLRSRGFAVWALNWRGQGGSSRTCKRPRRGYIHTFDQYLSDFSDFLAHLEAHEPAWCSPSPLVFAHSMGGHLALRWAHDHPGRIGQLLLSAPMLGIVLPAPRPLIRALAEALTVAGQGERFLPKGTEDVGRVFEGNDLTGDRGRFERYLALLDAQPDLITGGATVGWLRAALASLSVTDQAGFAERITTPCLMFTAALDTLVPPADLRAFAGRMPNAVCVRLPHARHEVCQESDEVLSAVWRHVDEFLR